MGPGMFDDVMIIFWIMLALVPLGLWKLIEIICWLIAHLKIV
jgi:hypothetical protein